MASREPPLQNRRVLICGGGIVGTCIAYYLAERGVCSTIIERHEVAGAASGKAAGFLAFDWNDGTPTAELSRLSFTLHQKLAEKFKGVTDYRAVSSLGIAAAALTPRDPTLTAPRWLDGNLLGVQALGTAQTCAQVHPFKLTKALLKAATQNGAAVLHGEVQGLEWTDVGKESRTAQGVWVDGKVLEADVVILAMGPWSVKAAEWIPVPPISAKKYHSVVVAPGQEISPHVVFLNHITADGQKVEPEIYPRPDGTVYICGEPQSVPLPEAPEDVVVDPALCRSIQSTAGEVATSLQESKVMVEQSCYLPLSPDGVPIIGKVPHTQNVYIATGHSCWGILNSPATGLIVSELLLDGKCSSLASASAFDPRRFTSRHG